MQTLSLHSLSRALASNFAPRFLAQFWRNRQNTKCSGFSIDISLNSDIIESHQLNASQDCFAGVSFARGTRLNCTQIERRRNTMKIIKRNGSEVPFDITKIITAVTKASDSVSRKSSLTQEQGTAYRNLPAFPGDLSPAHLRKRAPGGPQARPGLAGLFL